VKLNSFTRSKQSCSQRFQPHPLKDADILAERLEKVDSNCSWKDTEEQQEDAA